MPYYKPPDRLLQSTIEGQQKWLRTFKEVESVVKEDFKLQYKAQKGFCLRERHLPVEVIGRFYAQYCDLLNRLYDAYLNNMQLQRIPYMKHIIEIIVKRLFELRNELVHLIVNDYIYVDGALIQLQKTPYDIEIVVPYHFAMEAREDSLEDLLRRLWKEADHRYRFPPKVKTPKPPPVETSAGMFDDEETQRQDEPGAEDVEEEEVIEVTPVPSVHTVIPEEFIHALVIQRHERFRMFFRRDFQQKCANRWKYMVRKPKDAPRHVRVAATALIQKVYRHYMRLKRKKLQDFKRDVILGILPKDPFAPRPFKENMNKMYAAHSRKREILMESYIKDFEREKTRLWFFKKDNQIADITVHIWEWFKEWFKGYGFPPEFPFEAEGGTVLVLRGQYNTIEERQEEDERRKKRLKGKTKEQLKNEKEKEKEDAKRKAEVERDKAKREALTLFKLRCIPTSDPGYTFKASDADIAEVLRNYSMSWSFFDQFPPELTPESVIGYMMSLLTEDLMVQLHQECRVYVDELRRLDLKLLIKAQQVMYRRLGWKYPKVPRRRPPKAPPVPIPLSVDDLLLKIFEPLFDAKLISKPTTKLSEICGDLNFNAYECNIKDPDASFPPPCYGDVKRRLIYSCVYGIGMEETAVRNKSVMLLGQQRHGKSFLVDAVAGEINAIKIDISPEVFTGRRLKPGRMLPRVLLAARAFQPAVIYFRDVERVFYKKVPYEQRHLKPKSIKKSLEKLLKAIDPKDKIIFIATCSDPWAAKTGPLVKLFSEIILVPRLDYASTRQFFYEKFQRLGSLPPDACMYVQPLAHLMQGYGFGFLMETYHSVMSADRIVKLNVRPLELSEFLEPLIENEIFPMSIKDFQKYTEFYNKYSPLKKEREEYAIINLYRKMVYKKLAEKKAKAEAKKQKEGGQSKE